MPKKLAKSDLVAVLTIFGLSMNAVAQAADSDRSQSLSVKDRSQSTKLGSDSACGKGSCGTDEKGAKAAQEKHEKKPAKAKSHTSKAKTKSEAKKSGEAKKADDSKKADEAK
jgi:hypothetical protein